MKTIITSDVSETFCEIVNALVIKGFNVSNIHPNVSTKSYQCTVESTEDTINQMLNKTPIAAKRTHFRTREIKP